MILDSISYTSPWLGRCFYSATIYFDFNPGIKTNTTYNTYNEVVEKFPLIN